MSVVIDQVLSSISPFWAVTNALARGVLLKSAARLPKPVISVGNIVAGGVGKTEVAAAIAARLAHQGKRVVVASRGYGSSWQERGGVAHDAAAATALRFPDESIVVLKKAPGSMVAVGADRLGVLRRHWEELSPDVVLLDDGFQHFKIARQLDVLVHDFSVRWPILRELPSQLTRAGVRIALSELPAVWKKSEEKFPWVKARYKLIGAVDASGTAHRLPARALVFCGLGNPARLKRSLEQSGVEVAGFKRFADHVDYGDTEVRKIVAWHKEMERKQGRLLLLTSLKDYVKLGSYIESLGGIAGFEPRWIELKLEFQENEALLWKAVDDVIRSG